MNTAELSREQRIAHLALQGWEPVLNETTERAGIYSPAISLGFSVRPRQVGAIDDQTVKLVRRELRESEYVGCAWDLVTDWHLDRIDERLAAL